MANYFITAASRIDIDTKEEYEACATLVARLKRIVRNLSTNPVSERLGDITDERAWEVTAVSNGISAEKTIYDLLSGETLESLEAVLSCITFTHKPRLDENGNVGADYSLHYASKDVRPRTLGKILAILQFVSGVGDNWIVPYACTCSKLVEGGFGGGLVSSECGKFNVVTTTSLTQSAGDGFTGF